MTTVHRSPTAWTDRLLNPLRKAFAMRFSNATGFATTLMPRSGYNFAGQVKPWRSAPVVACVQWVARNFPEAPVHVLRTGQDGRLEAEPTHPMSVLLQRPNDFYSGALMMMAVACEYVVEGNAYLVKVRSGAGRVVELWWVPGSMIEPKWPLDGSEFVSHYEYRPSGTPARLDRADVVHMRNGLDGDNPRKGRAPLASLMREIMTDDEAANFTAALLRNLGVPGVILAPRDGMTATRAALEEIKLRFEETFGGDKRGSALMLSAPTDVQVLSFSPQQMDLRALRRIPEERVSAVLGIPAIVAGLGAGLDRSTYANMSEAREMAYENCIIPMQRLVAADLTSQLLPDFEGDAAGVTVQAEFDLSRVRVLQDDEGVLATRVVALLSGGVMTRAEARAEVGLPVGPFDDVYHLPVSVIEVAPGEERASAPEMAAAGRLNLAAVAVKRAAAPSNGRHYR